MHPLVEQYLAHLSLERGLAARTIEAYSQDLANYIVWLKEHPPEAADTPLILKYVINLRQTGLAVSSRHRRLVSLRGFYRFLLQEKIIDGNPAMRVALPRYTPAPPRILTSEEIERLLAVPAEPRAQARRDRLMLTLMYVAALRVSELIGLSYGDLDLKAGVLQVAAHSRQQRAAPIDPATVAQARTYLAEVRPQLTGPRHSLAMFISRRGQPLTRQGFWKLLKRYSRLAGITTPLSPHSLRHARAAHLAAAGISIHQLRNLLGHAHVAATENYCKTEATDLTDMHRRYHPREDHGS